jgi:hypothetical protein
MKLMSETSAHPEMAQLDEIHESVRGYMPPLLPRLLLTYGLPVLGVLLANILLPLLIPDFVPTSTATILTFAVHLLILYLGWRTLEQRTHATALFVLYSTYTTQRRNFRKSLQSDAETPLSLADVRAAAERFIHTAQEHGLEPRSER